MAALEVEAADGRIKAGAEAAGSILGRLLPTHPLRESMESRRNYDPTNISWLDAAIAGAGLVAVLKFFVV